MLDSVIGGILQGISRLIVYAMGFILDLVFGLFNDFNFPLFTNQYSSYLVDFWNMCFRFVGWFRSAFCIDAFSWQLLTTMLVIRLTYKPAISIVKMFIEWYNKLKL